MNTHFLYISSGIQTFPSTNYTIYVLNRDNYKVFVLDEAHERTCNLDIIMGLFKKFTLKRDDVRLIITSATINSSQYVKFFSAAEIKCSEELYEIKTEYCLYDVRHKYFHETINKIKAVAHDRLAFLDSTQPVGESEIILVFWPDTQTIRSSESILLTEFEKLKDRIEIAGMYGALPHEEQSGIMKKPAKNGCIKIVLATNVAETSITFERVMTVIDSGMQKISHYSPKTGATSLETIRISQNSAIQRTGRTGRQGPGKCYRIYSKTEFLDMREFTEPAILQQNIGILLLTLLQNSIDAS